MKFSPIRALVFALIALPIGFILTALGFAVTTSTIDFAAIFPLALVMAVGVGCVAGFWRTSPQSPSD